MKKTASFTQLSWSRVVPSVVLVLAIFLSVNGLVLAQSGATTSQSDEIYTIQVGDTLTRIALKYNLSVGELAAYNNIANPNLIIAGQQLSIPAEALVSIPRPLTPSPLTDTTTLTETDREADEPPAESNEDSEANDSEEATGPATYTVQQGDTLFTIAQSLGVRMTRLAEENNIVNMDYLSVGQVLLVPGAATLEDMPLPPLFENVSFSEQRIAQGRTLQLDITLSEAVSLNVNLEGRPVILLGGGTEYQGLVGIHALSEVGVYALNFEATLSDSTVITATQNILIFNGPYRSEVIQVIPGRENLLQPEIVQSEFAKVSAVWSEYSPEKRWQGTFRFPVDDTRVTSSFGTRRAYQGGAVASYHAGTDFGGGVGTPIYAPASGVVALAEPLDVRGNAILLDHGLGLFSGYWHLSEILVAPGDAVEPGQLIGLLGGTGLVTGPHLHWEMRLGGIAVEPLQWVEESLP